MRSLYGALSKFERGLGKGIGLLAAIGMALIAVIIFMQVICRYVFSNALSWSEELCVYIEVWIIFLTAGYALGKGQHICADFVVQYLPEKLKFVLQKINSLIFVAFSAFCIRYSYVFICSEFGQKMASIKLPKWYVYLALLVGSVIMLFYSILLVLKGKEDEPC